MGWLSKIVKGVKNVFKGIGKVVGKVWKGVKKFAKSKLGKLLITAALIYAGGAAIGAWGGGGAGSAAATTATELAATTIPEAAVAGATTAGGTAAGLSTAAETAAVLEGAGAAATQAAAPGLISQAGTLMAANPMATMVGGQMLSSAFTPSAAEEQEEIDRKRREQSNIAGVYGTGEGDPISLGLVQQAQQQDLRTPTYKYTPGGRNG